jgi:hypothetical protein
MIAESDYELCARQLKWLTEQGWSYIRGWDQADDNRRFCRVWKHLDTPGPNGKRLNVVTRHATTECLAVAKIVEFLRKV